MTSLLGRGDELELLLRRATSGDDVPVTVVTGEAGIGKTSLVGAAAEVLRERGWTVRRTRGTRDGGAPPFWLWEQALGSPVQAQQERFLLFEQLRQRLAADSPVVLVVDDAQWADEPSLRALLHVVRHHRQGGLAVLVTVRTLDEPGAGWDLVGPELVREPSVRELALSGLSGPEARACVSASAAILLPDAVVEQACALAGGNPFFLTELGRSWRGGAEALPMTLADVVQHRVSALSHEAQQLLRAASVLGEQVDLAVAARLVEQSAMEVLPAADEALSAGLLRRVGASVRFAHGLVRHALEQQLSLQQLVGLHLRAAGAIEELYAGDLRPHYAQLARHWCAAAVAGHPENGIFWATRAAELAYDALAWEEASRLYDLALATAGSGHPAGRRAELLLGRARADVAAGRLPAAHSACREAVELAAGRSDLVATAALTIEAVGNRGWDRDLRDWCSTALTDPELDPTVRARLLGRLTEASIYSGDWDGAERTSAEALALGSGPAADPAALVAGLRARQLALSGPEHSDARRRLADRMVALGLEYGSPADEMWGLLWRIDTSFEDGRLHDVGLDANRLAWCVEQLRTPIARWHLLVVRAALAQSRADFAAAESAGWEAFRLLEATGHPAGFGAFMSLLSLVGHHTGYHPVTTDPPQHQEHAAEVRGELFAMIGPAMALAECGRLEEARALYARVGPPQSWSIPPYFLLTALGCGCATACALGLDDDVRWFRQQLEPWRGRHLVVGAGVGSTMGPAEIALGTAAARLGDLAAAEGDLKAAATACRESGARGFAVEADCRRAEVLVRSGQVAAGAALARSVLLEARQLGMAPWVVRLESLLVDENPLTPREREVALLVAQGLSNRAIAATLVISERTAENHVQSILRKLGLTNRAQLAVHMSTRTSTSPMPAAEGLPSVGGVTRSRGGTMSFVHVTSTPGHSLRDYERVLDALGSEPVLGRVSHRVGESDGSLCIVDVWEDRAAADRFAAERLFPAFQSAGVNPPPSTTIITFQEVDRG